MKKSTMMLILLVAILLMGSVSAQASSSGTLTLTGVGSNIATGAGFATYPYFFNLNANNSTSSVTLMCDDQTDDVWINETWNVNIYTMTDIINSENLGAEVGQMNPLNGLLGVTANSVTQGTGATNGLDAEQRVYADAAYMFQNIGTYGNVITNEAVWELFADKGQTNPFTQGDQTQIAALFGAAQSFTNSLTQISAETDFSNIRFYTPNCNGTVTFNNQSVANCGQTGPNGTPASNGSYFSRPQEYIGSVPEPDTLALLAIGLIGLGITIRRKGISFKNVL